MGSQKESLRPRKSAGLPSWAQESVSSTEQLMSSFYSTQEPTTAPGIEPGKSASPEGEHAPNQKPGDSDAFSKSGFAPLNISLADDQPDRSDQSEVASVATSPSTPPASTYPIDRKTMIEIAARDGLGERAEKPSRTRSAAAHKRQSESSPERGWSSQVLIAGAVDSGLVELLPGKSSALYKEFYLRTHAADPPVTEVRATKQTLSSWSSIANRNTLIKHIQHLIAVRLIKRTMAMGDTEGPMYTVRCLEDVGIPKETAEAFYRQFLGQKSAPAAPDQRQRLERAG